MGRPAPRILADAQTAILRGIFRQFAADLLAVLGEPFEQLSPEVQAYDDLYRDAIHRVAALIAVGQ